MIAPHEMAGKNHPALRVTKISRWPPVTSCRITMVDSDTKSKLADIKAELTAQAPKGDHGKS